MEKSATLNEQSGAPAPASELQVLFGSDPGRYFVFGEGGDAPARIHTSRYSAHKEVRRLAQLNPGRRFHLLKLKETVMVPEAAEA